MNRSRRFILHYGPTNSGKTYSALKALKAASSGVYLGPLRLLALEVFDDLNGAGVPCSLLTGEESIEVPFSHMTASTVEMCDFSQHYDTAVIDEAQLIADMERGGRWTDAILFLDADEIHICMAPEAADIIQKLISELGSPCEVVQHDRLTPLQFSGVLKDLSHVQPGDALITFSRKQVLSIAAALEQKQVKASVIYGALPPQARREEVRRFTSGENTVAVATDAIGMGVSLPIRRIIFCQDTKFDGSVVRQLRPAEVQQIAGRAGRFGKYDVGEVLTLTDSKVIRNGLAAKVEPIRKLTIPFPAEAVGGSYQLPYLLNEWQRLPKSDIERRVDMSTPQALLRHIYGMQASSAPKTIYQFITCPVDTGNMTLVMYWKQCCKDILDGKPLREPNIPEDDLSSCEMKYKAYDIMQQMSRRSSIPAPDGLTEKKRKLCERINGFLKESKAPFLRRCSNCGKPLSITSIYGMCKACHEARTYLYDMDFPAYPR